MLSSLVRGSFLKQGLGQDTRLLNEVLNLDHNQVISKVKEDIQNNKQAWKERAEKALRSTNPRIRLAAKLLTGKVDAMSLKPENPPGKHDTADSIIVCLQSKERLKARKEAIIAKSYLDNDALDKKYDKMYQDAKGMVPKEYFLRLRVEEEKKAYKARCALENFERYNKVQNELNGQVLFEIYKDNQLVDAAAKEADKQLKRAHELISSGRSMNMRDWFEMNPKAAQRMQDILDSGEYGNPDNWEKGLQFKGWDSDSTRFPYRFWFMPQFEAVDRTLSGARNYLLSEEELARVEEEDKKAEAAALTAPATTPATTTATAKQ